MDNRPRLEECDVRLSLVYKVKERKEVENEGVVQRISPPQ